MADHNDLKHSRYWPIGAHLRFKAKAEVKPRFVHLRGTPVVVLSAPREFVDDGYRQKVYAFGGVSAYERTGWAQPAQLEPCPDVSKCDNKREAIGEVE